MDYTPLGPTGLLISRIGLGTRILHEVPDPHSLLDAAVDLGINWIDTADSYGAVEGAEDIIGGWGGRHDILIASKVGVAALVRSRIVAGSIGVSAHHIRRACEASLRRLRVDAITLYQIHKPRPEMVLEDTAWGMARLAAAGKIDYWGTSNFEQATVSSLRRLSGGPPPVSEQCRAANVAGWRAGFPNFGVLAYRAIMDGPARDLSGPRRALDAGATAVIVGARTPEQLREIVEATWAEG